MADENTVVANNSPGGGYLALSWLFILLAFVFVIWGAVRMFSYDEFSDKIVGGDAYNYIVLATRGVGLIAIGCCMAALSATFAVFARIAKA